LVGLLNIAESMFDSLVTATDGSSGADGVGAWARVENAACARRLAATADLLEARYSADGSAEREQWCLDNWDVVAAEVAAAQNVSQGVGSCWWDCERKWTIPRESERYRGA
jgi:hypothetical protein